MRKYFWNPLFTALGIDVLIILICILTIDFHSVIKAFPVFLGFEILRFYFPFILISMNYIYHDKRYRINLSKKELEIVKEKKIISFREVRTVEKYTTFAKFKNRTVFLWDQFHYYKLTTYSGEELFISCLKTDRLGMYFSKDLFTRKSEFVPFYERK